MIKNNPELDKNIDLKYKKKEVVFFKNPLTTAEVLEKKSLPYVKYIDADSIEVYSNITNKTQIKEDFGGRELIFENSILEMEITKINNKNSTEINESNTSTITNSNESINESINDNDEFWKIIPENIEEILGEFDEKGKEYVYSITIEKTSNESNETQEIELDNLTKTISSDVLMNKGEKINIEISGTVMGNKFISIDSEKIIE